MGSTFTLRLEDGGTDEAKIVGKGTGRGGGGNLVMVIVEWPDGARQFLPYEDFLASLP